MFQVVLRYITVIIRQILLYGHFFVYLFRQLHATQHYYVDIIHTLFLDQRFPHKWRPDITAFAQGTWRILHGCVKI